ncbi:MAG: hypothetical protein WC328_17510 [Kiritimatiellia bacterium]
MTITDSDLEYDLVFMNTCVSADKVFYPVGNANDPRNPPISWDEEAVGTHSVMAIGDRLNAKNYIGWRCSVNRMISMWIPGMLVAQLDTRFDGTKDVAQAVDAIQRELTVNRNKDYWWYAPQLTVLRSDGQKFDLKKRYGN